MTWLDVNGLSLRTELEGSGPRLLVLIHELGGSLESFDGLTPWLSGCRTLRYDQRGAGSSEKPRRSFTMDDHASDLDSLLDALRLDGPVHLAGVAAGAAIAVAFSRSRPDRVASLSLCAPALTVPPERRAYLRERSDAAARDGMRAIVEPSLARSYPDHLRGARDLFEAYRARFLANDPVAYGLANAALSDARLDDALCRISVPCQVLAGRHDRLRPPTEARLVADRITGATFHVVESGHIMPVQAPREMAELLAAFIERCGRPASRAAE